YSRIRIRIQIIRSNHHWLFGPRSLKLTLLKRCMRAPGWALKLLLITGKIRSIESTESDGRRRQDKEDIMSRRTEGIASFSFWPSWDLSPQFMSRDRDSSEPFEER